MPLPKVLILNQPFIRSTGGGITLSNLFEGWDKDNIAVACTPHYFNLEVETDICDTYYRLGVKEYKNKFPFNLFQHKYPSGSVDFEAEAKPFTKNAKVSVNDSPREDILNKFVYPTLEYIGLFHNLSRIELSVDFRKWMDDYSPDVIYTQAFSLEGVRFSLAVEDYLKKPMVFHMMDDWPSSVSERGPFKNFWSNKINDEFRQLLDKSSLLLSISEGMSDEYRERYGKKFIPFHNPIHLDFWKKDQRKRYDLKKSPMLLYSGRTGIGIDSSLTTTARAVEMVNKELNTDLRFIIRTDKKPAWVDDFASCSFETYVNYKDVPKSLAQADMLLLPYDFSAEALKFVQYSMPTKASEYMVSGSPILLFAPEETALAQYGLKYNCFKTVLKNECSVLSMAIKALLTDSELRRSLGTIASELAESQHDAKVVVPKFRALIQNLC